MLTKRTIGDNLFESRFSAVMHLVECIELWHGLPARENTAKMAVPQDTMVIIRGFPQGGVPN